MRQFGGGVWNNRGKSCVTRPTCRAIDEKYPIYVTNPLREVAYHRVNLAPSYSIRADFPARRDARNLYGVKIELTANLIAHTKVVARNRARLV